MESIVNLFDLKDFRPTPDPVYPYNNSLHDVPLVIDNGSWNCRAGWASDENAKLVFRPVVAKQRGKKDYEAQIGNDISNIEVVRWLLKTQFDRNVVTQYDIQEQIFDYIFSHLGINTVGCVDHPIVLTEPVANPNYCRQLMSELLFECYHVPKIAYGIDAMFSYHYNNSNKSQNGLVLSCGYHACHILPVLNGKMDIGNARRINVGGSHITSFMHRLLQLRYPVHFAAITLSRAEEFVHDHTYLADDYFDALKQWEDPNYQDENIRVIQLPYTAIPGNPTSAEAQKERKMQQIRRLQDINAKRREERLAADEEQLLQLMTVKELGEYEDDDDTFNKALGDVGYSNALELQVAITQLDKRIQRTKEKMMSQGKEEDVSQEQEPKPKRFCSEFVAGNFSDFDAWIGSVRQKRQELLEARSQRRQRKSDMAKRRTLASQERMKIISQLAAEKKKEDNFGQNDDDWDVYKAINKDGGDTDSEEEQEKLQEFEQVLRDHDEEFQKEMENLQEVNYSMNVAEYYHLHLGTEQIRVPELLFQPSMMGIEQAGVVDAMDYILSRYSEQQQELLVKNVFLAGGCSLFQGFQKRMEKELLAIRPFQSKYHVTRAADPINDPWNGARMWALNQDYVNKHSITRADYDEKGSDYLKEHCASNAFFPAPAPPKIIPPPSLPPPSQPLQQQILQPL